MIVDMEKEYKMSAARAQELQEELNYLKTTRSDEVAEQIKVARGFGDLSENYEYKAAKQELRRCDSRLRYLRRMINTAKVISVQSTEGVIELFDRVEIYYEEDDETETIQLMTTLRQDALSGVISKESPLGKALLGHRVGDRVEVKVSPEVQYFVVVRKITKGTDDDSLPISSF